MTYIAIFKGDSAASIFLIIYKLISICCIRILKKAKHRKSGSNTRVRYKVGSPFEHWRMAGCTWCGETSMSIQS